MMISLIEQAVFTPPPGLEDWRFFRIEYGGHAADCIWEGAIWLPPNINPDTIEKLLEEV
jgi:hypothetical protein